MPQEVAQIKAENVQFECRAEYNLFTQFDNEFKIQFGEIWVETVLRGQNSISYDEHKSSEVAYWIQPGHARQARP